MKPNQTLPLLANLAPVAAGAPQIFIVAAIVVGVIWLCSDKEDSDEPPRETEKAQPDPSPQTLPQAGVSQLKPACKRITREDLAEALHYGTRPMTRLEAVAALQAQGFRKTAAYRALSIDGRFNELLKRTPDGLIEWVG